MPRDTFRPCRIGYSNLLKSIVANPVVSGFAMGLPTYFLLGILGWALSIYSKYPVYYSYLNNSAYATFYTILAFTILAWIIEIISIHYMMPNIIGICAFCHGAIGSWWLVNFVILFFIGWMYLPIGSIFGGFLLLLIPAIVWHITGDIIRAYKEKLIETIAELNRTGLAAQASAVIIEGEELRERVVV